MTATRYLSRVIGRNCPAIRATVGKRQQVDRESKAKLIRAPGPEQPGSNEVRLAVFYILLALLVLSFAACRRDNLPPSGSDSLSPYPCRLALTPHAGETPLD